VAIELENRLPAPLSDLNESHKDDIICSDPTPADGPIGRHALMPRRILFRSQSHEEWSKESDGELTCRDLHTARATRAASDSMGIVLCVGVWSRVMIWVLHSL
jgi:hypothetical protein